MNTFVYSSLITIKENKYFQLQDAAFCVHGGRVGEVVWKKESK